jgi:hypothetical protein
MSQETNLLLLTRKASDLELFKQDDMKDLLGNTILTTQGPPHLFREVFVFVLLQQHYA